MHPQAGLGNENIYNKPKYDQVQIGRVTSVADYDKYGRIEVIFLDYSQPFPVWVNGSIDRKPVEGDQVLVGFIQGRPDAPYLAGFIRNESYTANYIVVEKDRILLQVSPDETDKEERMADITRLGRRNFIEVTNTSVRIYATTDSQLILTAPEELTINLEKPTMINASEVTIHADTVKIADGSDAVARVGDQVEVSVPTIGTCSGRITTGQDKVKI